MDLLFNSDPYLKHCEAKILDIRDGSLVLDRTIFYPLGGGQPGDTGTLNIDGSSICVIDTVKGRDHNEILHISKTHFSEDLIGKNIQCNIDWDRRYKMMKMHTCLHILCSLIDAPITGAQLNEKKGRIDFNVDPSLLNKQRIEKDLNQLIEDGYPTETKEISEKELRENSKLVRTMMVHPPIINNKVRILQIGNSNKVVDVQPCGGTHVKNTSEIGKVIIKKIENKGKQNRRVIVEFDSH